MLLALLPALLIPVAAADDLCGATIVADLTLTADLTCSAGIDFITTVTGAATGNVLLENAIAMNTCGLKGLTAGNTLTENVFEGNGTDNCS